MAGKVSRRRSCDLVAVSRCSWIAEMAAGHEVESILGFDSVLSSTVAAGKVRRSDGQASFPGHAAQCAHHPRLTESKMAHPFPAQSPHLTALQLLQVLRGMRTLHPPSPFLQQQNTASRQDLLPAAGVSRPEALSCPST